MECSMTFKGSNKSLSTALGAECTKSNEEEAMVHFDALHATTPYARTGLLQVPNTDPYAPRPQRSTPHSDRIERTRLDRATAQAMVNAGSMPVSLYVQMFGLDRPEIVAAGLHVPMFDVHRQEMSCLDEVEH
jgi:hypothetical protein